MSSTRMVRRPLLNAWSNIIRRRMIEPMSSGPFVTMPEKANSTLAMAWLQPVIERYEQEGMKNEAEELRFLQIKEGENIAPDMKHYSVGVNVTKTDYDD